MSSSREDGHVHLADYRAPAWRIRRAELQFDLDPEFPTAVVFLSTLLSPITLTLLIAYLR